MLRDECTSFFYLHEGQTPADELLALSDYARQHDLTADCYGSGGPITAFEQEIASLLGKKAAVFMPSGTMAQQIAMRLWSERNKNNTFACHATCHMEFNEYHAYQYLHDLKTCLLGNKSSLFQLNDLKKCSNDIACLLIELPQRWIGGQLPSWDELVGICDYARSKKIALHLDGARLWECTEHYQKSLQEIAALFDSVYVSFYKTLGNISGAMLLGNSDFIDESRIWLRRHGGNLYQLYPYVISAQLKLQQHLPRIPVYCKRAKEIAAVLNQFEEIKLTPDTPPTNMMHAHFDFTEQVLIAARDTIAEKHKTWMCGKFHPSYNQGRYMEIFVGENLVAMSDEQIKQIMSDFIEHCHQCQ